MHQHANLKWDYPQEVTSKVCVCVSVCARIWAVPVVMLRLFHSYLWSEEYCYNLSPTLFNLLLNVDSSSSLFTLPTWGTVCTNCSKVGSGGGCRFRTGLSPGLCCSFICKIEMQTHTYMELCCYHWSSLNLLLQLLYCVLRMTRSVMLTNWLMNVAASLCDGTGTRVSLCLSTTIDCSVVTWSLVGWTSARTAALVFS